MRLPQACGQRCRALHRAEPLLLHPARQELAQEEEGALHLGAEMHPKRVDGSYTLIGVIVV